MESQDVAHTETCQVLPLWIRLCHLLLVIGTEGMTFLKPCQVLPRWSAETHLPQWSSNRIEGGISLSRSSRMHLKRLPVPRCTMHAPYGPDGLSLHTCRQGVRNGASYLESSCGVPIGEGVVPCGAAVEIATAIHPDPFDLCRPHVGRSFSRRTVA